MNELAYRVNYVLLFILKVNVLEIKLDYFRYREIIQVHGYLPSQIPQWDCLLMALNLEYFLDIC